MKFTPFVRSLGLCATILFLTTSVDAHPGHDGTHELTWDFSGGALHPLSGLDHMLAMIAIGVWAAQLGGRARWAVPMAFMAALTVGASLGAGGAGFSWLEQSIAASGLVLSLLVVSAARLPLAAGMVLASIFALFHGLAHGVEMPVSAGGFGYGLGFFTVTAALHSVGLAVGMLGKNQSIWVPRTVGAALVVAGGWMVIT